MVPPACTLFQCSRSCGSGIQKRELRCGERDLQGGYVLEAAHLHILHALIDLYRHLRPTVSVLYYLFTALSNFLKMASSPLSSPTQVCGVPYTEVQEYGQTFGGPPAVLQPKSVCGGPPSPPWSDHL